MNGFTFSLIVGSGVILGFVFADLLEELGVTRKASRFLITALALPVLAFAGFMIYPTFTHGIFMVAPMDQFYTSSGGIFLWFTVALLLGSVSRAFVHFVTEQRHT
jgi:hypothetical protein